MMKSGKSKLGWEPFVGSLSLLFEKQKEFQKLITKIELPEDNVEWFSYHMQAMTEELGEVLGADKRWKTHRNAHYDPGHKLEEIADVFITAINIAMYSGIDSTTLYLAIAKKIDQNTKKRNEA